MITILGAGGAIANHLVDELAAETEPVRLVGRSPKPVARLQTLAADLSDPSQALTAVSGSRIVFLLVGLKYDRVVWRELWPKIMRNTIEACKRSGAWLIFFDNVYMYGKVDGVMTEETPFNPCSKKGQIRAEIASTLLEEMKTGNLTALIARCPDFFGPRAPTGVANVLVFDNFAQGKPAYWLVNDSLPHSFAFTPDAAKSLVVLAKSESAWNQTWHVPAAGNPPTGKEFIDQAAREFGVRPRRRLLIRPMIKMAGWFDTTIGELYEMLYQYDRPYLFDSTKFQAAFGLKPTPYADSIRATVNSYKAMRPKAAA